MNPPPGTRLQSLDAFRGLIMFTLLCGGIFQPLKDIPFWHPFAVQNEHVRWEGCVYWDLIQPSFMFMVGVAMPFAFARRAASGDPWSRQLRHAVVRAVNLMVLGILLDHFGAGKIQIGFIRVLQQIAVGYLLAFFLLGKSVRIQGLAAVLLLAGYQLWWMFNPWNGAGGPWAMGNENLGSAFDFWLLGRHYPGYYVGLNAIPATATILFGVMAGQLLLHSTKPVRACWILLSAGLAGVILGAVLGQWFPVIKRIWTPSFAVYAGGWSTLMLLGFYWIMDVKGLKKWAFPLVVTGMNSIAAYVLGNVFGGWFRSFSGAWIAGLKEPLGPAWFAVLQHGLFAVSAWLVLYWCYHRKLFFKL